MATVENTTGSLNSLAKEVFPEKSEIWSQIDQKAPALDLVERTNKVPFLGKLSDGRYLKIPVRTNSGANPAVGIAELGGLPTAQKQTTSHWQFNTASHWQALELSGMVFDTLDGGDASVQDVFTFEMKHQIMDARKELNRLLHSDGSGALAACVSNSGATVTVDSTADMKVGTQCIIKGETTGTADSGQPSNASAVVETIPSATTVTFETEAGVQITGWSSLGAADSVYRYDSQGLAINGFGIICSNANPTNWGGGSPKFGNVDRSTNTWAQAQNLSAASSIIDIQTHVQPFIDTIRRAAGQHLSTDGEGATWICFTGYQNFRALMNAMRTDQRTAPQQTMLQSKYPSIDIEGAFFVVDDDAPPASIRFVHGPDLRRYVRVPWRWDDKTGSIWHRRTATDGRDADVYKAYLKTRQQMAVVRCSTMGQITNINATS